MLYVTTRMEKDAFTAHRSLAENRGPGGGFYLPMRMPEFDRQQIIALGEKSFSQNVAEIVNLLFNTDLDGWAVEFAIGRYPVKMVQLNSRVSVAETWHNPSWRLERLAMGIEKAVRQSDEVREKPSGWLMIAARIAVLFGIFGELIHEGFVTPEKPMDVAVPSGNFSAAMAVWYARQWGLPIGNLVCACNENAGVWNLIHKGEIRTDAAAVKTNTPACDNTVPENLERLIYATLGVQESTRFVEVCRKGGTFYLEPYQLEQLRDRIWISVVSEKRLESTLNLLYRNNGYLADPYTALVYSGLIDYRSRTGEGRPALILADESPAFSLNILAKSLGMGAGELKKRINKA